MTAAVEKKEKINKAVNGIGLNPSYYWRVDYAEVYPYAPGFSEDEQVRIVQVGKGNEVKSIEEITAQSRVIRLLRDEKKEGFRVHSTSEGLKVIMNCCRS